MKPQPQKWKEEKNGSNEIIWTMATATRMNQNSAAAAEAAAPQ